MPSRNSLGATLPLGHSFELSRMAGDYSGNRGILVAQTVIPLARPLGIDEGAWRDYVNLLAKNTLKILRSPYSFLKKTCVFDLIQTVRAEFEGRR